MSNLAELRTPAEVEQLLEDKAIDLDQLGKDLDAATDALSDTEEAWTRHFDQVVEELEEQAQTSKDFKVPGEDAKKSIARRRPEGQQLWFAFRRAERDVKRIEKRITQTANVISAFQSKLRQVREEARAA